MTTRHDDLLFLQSAFSELRDYLLSDQIFWPLGSGERLSLGAMLLAYKRFSAVAETHEERSKINAIRDEIVSTRTQWRTNWSNKASKEFGARLRQWAHVLSEIFSENKMQTVVFPHEVTWRVILELLEHEILRMPEEDIAELEALDKRLKAGSKRGDFVWASELQRVFPEEQYWFLYTKLPIGEQ